MKNKTIGHSNKHRKKWRPRTSLETMKSPVSRPEKNPTEKNHRIYRTAMTKKILRTPQIACFLKSNAHAENAAENKNSIRSAQRPREKELMRARR